MTLPIPNEALDDRLGFVGTSGSGKTYAAKGRVERLLSMHHRVVIVDPLDVWYGLRLKLDGKTAAFPVAILGGRHGDLPLNEHSGALIGEAVAKSPESCIVSLTGLRTSGARQRFMLAFLDSLYERTDPDARDPYHVIFDEADLWAPQKPMGNEAMLAHLMEEIVRRGRVKGFIPWLITQRPAVLNKNVLSQVDGLIAMKLTSSQDRDAIGAWIEGQADRQQGKEILANLPTLAQGTGVVWLPGRNILKTASFPENQTFDSSRTPKRGEKKRETSLTPLDLPGLKDRLAKVEAETKANDPAALKKRIAELEAQARKKTQPIYAGMEQIVAAEERGRAEGEATAKRWFAQWIESRARIVGHVAGLIARANEAAANIDNEMAPPELPQLTYKSTAKLGRGLASLVDERSRTPAPVAQRSERAAHNGVVPGSNPGGRTDLKPAFQKVINAIGWWYKIGRHPVERNRACVVAGFSPKASTFGVYVTELVKMGLVAVTPGMVALTDDGLKAAQIPDAVTKEDLYEMAAGLLTPQEKKIFTIVYEAYPDEIRRDEVAEKAGLSPTASTAGVYMAGVSACGIIEPGSRGHVKAADWLFPF